MTKIGIKLAAAATLAVGALAATAPAQAHGYGYGWGHHRPVVYGYTYVPRCTIVYRDFYTSYGYVSRPVKVCG